MLQALLMEMCAAPTSWRGDGDRVWLIDLGRSVVKASKDEKDQDKQQLKAILR